MWLHTHMRHPNGSANYIQRLVRELESQGHTVTVMLESPSSDSKMYWLRFGHYLERIQQKIQTYLDLSKHNLCVQPRINVWPEPDAIIASIFPMTMILPTLKTNAKKFIFCFEPHVYFHDQEVIQRLPIHVRILMENIKRKYGAAEMEAHRRCKVLTYSDFVIPHIRNVYGVGARSIGMGVDIPEPTWKFDFNYILHSTDGSPVKNTEMLVQSIPVFKKDFPRLEVKIINNQTNPLSREEYLNVCKGATLGVYMGTGAAGVQSLFILEMMSHRKCVVRPDNSPEVKEGVTGRTFKAGDIEDFQRVTLELLGDKEQRERLGRAARKHVIEKYNWQKTVRNLLRAIK